jgi:hypothetical protein
MYSFLKEDPTSGGFIVCALGLAMIGKMRSPVHALQAFTRLQNECHYSPRRTVSRLLRIPRHLLDAVSRRHCFGMKAADIAEALRAGNL